jgi:hypothetical protein
VRIAGRSATIVNETEPSTAVSDASETPVAEANNASPAMTRAEGDRLLADAKRLYKVAELVHSRRDLDGVDSAVLAHRSLAILLHLLLTLHGEEVPSNFPDLVERARRIAVTESLLAEDLAPDLLVVHEMREVAVQYGAEVSPSDVRRYDRAFVRSGEWFRAVGAYLDQRIPAQGSRFLRALAAALPVSVAFLIGLIIGKHVNPEARVPNPVPQLAPSVSPQGVGFAGTFFGDPEFKDVALTRTDSAISFDWEAQAPADNVPADHFSIRWEARLNVSESGKYTFYLVSDDGSRFLLDGSVVVDNWGNHAPVTKTGDILIEKGIHPIRVEYFDNIGSALIRLEWSSEFFERRLIVGRDLR